MTFDDAMAALQAYFGSVDAKVAALDATVAQQAAEIVALKAGAVTSAQLDAWTAALKAAQDKLATL